MDILENAREWAQHYQNKVIQPYRKSGELSFNNYQYVKNSTSPNGKGIQLIDTRLLFISSSGAYLPGEQSPFDAENPLGDYTIRSIPVNTPLEALDFAHDHYDQTSVRKDPQSLIPLQHLQKKVMSGELGGLTTLWISLMGYQPDASRIVEEVIPKIISIALKEKANGALLVPA